jgi:phosphoribosylglycinamide formyltransferase
VTDVPTCGGAAFAQSQNTDVLMYPPRASVEVPEGVRALTSEEELTETLRDELGIDFVILAGYLKLVPASTVTAFSRRMLNIHPGLLPAFGGKGMFGGKVHKAVIASGCRCALYWYLILGNKQRYVRCLCFDWSRHG